MRLQHLQRVVTFFYIPDLKYIAPLIRPLITVAQLPVSATIE